MFRRAFLKALAAFAAGAAVAEVDPELLAWQPGKKTIIVPPPAGWPVTEKAREIVRAAERELGISVRYIRHFNIERASLISRMDVLYGFAALSPNNVAVRVAGAPKRPRISTDGVFEEEGHIENHIVLPNEVLQVTRLDYPNRFTVLRGVE